MSDPDAPIIEPTETAASSTTAGDTAAPSAPAAMPAEGKPGGLDLSSLKIMPDWVANFGSRSSATDQSEPREDRPPRRSESGSRFHRNRDREHGRGPRPRGDRPPHGDKPNPRRDDHRSHDRGPHRHDTRSDGRRDRRDQPRRDWVELPRDIQTSVYPEEKSLDALASHIRSTGHAFSLFDIARAILSGGERFGVRFLCDPARAQPLYRITADGSLFLTREEAIRHILSSPALHTWYRVEAIELEEPKGHFPSVSVCGLSGEILGPASHHSFQTAVIRLHRERFSHMPIEDYKRRIRSESDPELIQKWKDQQRKTLRWIPLTADTGDNEPAPLTSRHEMEAHFRRCHADHAVAELREATVPGSIDKKQLSPALFILLRQAVESARKHLFEMSQKLAAGFDRRGLKTFKRRAGKMFVCRVRPRAVDPTVHYAGRVSAIIDALKKAPAGLQVTDLVKSLAPDFEPPKASPYQETAPALNEDQIAVLKDLRWLANEGYIIEFSDGLVTLGVQGEHPPAAKSTKSPAAQASQDNTAAEAPTDQNAPPAPPASLIEPEEASLDAPEAAPVSDTQPEAGMDSDKENLPDTPEPVQE